MAYQKVYDIDDWCEDYGCVLLFHFDSYGEPPKVLASSPIRTNFNDNGIGYWTHFTIPEWNNIFKDAIAIDERKTNGYKRNLL